MNADESDVVVQAVKVLSVPRSAPADSFVLHAPLELMARVGLLSFVERDQRDPVLERIQSLAAAYDTWGPPVDPPTPIEFTTVETCAAAVASAIARRDLEALDSALVWFTDRATAADARRLLGEAVADATAAAGHVPIGLHLLDHCSLSTGLLRGPLRELARYPERRVRWFHDAEPRPGGDLAEVLRRVPREGSPSRIFPLMANVEDSGWAAEVGSVATGCTLADATRTLLRAAVWSMVHDDAAHAAYGWSHCLTMPQAMLALAGRGVGERAAVALAATHLTGFRYALGRVEIGDLSDGAWMLWPSNDGSEAADVTSIATFAAQHHDAHLAKYALACIHAADGDPAWRPAYLAAAAHLCAWWRDR